MDGGRATPDDVLTAAEVGQDPPAEQLADGSDVRRASRIEGEGRTPRLTLDGFEGPLEQLLMLARARQIDLAQLSLPALIAQLVSALQQASPRIPLGQKGDWVVMAAWLVQLRSLLLLPADAPARQVAEGEADQLRTRLLSLQAMRTLAAWLEQRPRLGRDVFARGRPEIFGVAVAGMLPPDIVAFLWASLALFDDEPLADTTSLYHPRPLDLHDVATARERILQRLAEMPDGGRFEQFLPDEPAPADGALRQTLRRRSAWSSTFAAGLQLAKQGDVVLDQERTWSSIELRTRDELTGPVMS